MNGRQPNSGPYIVSYQLLSGSIAQVERHTWADACQLMRKLLIEDRKNVSVRFA